MNIQQLVSSLLKMGFMQNFVQIFAPKKKSRKGMWWASVIGVGISIIAVVNKWGNQKVKQTKPDQSSKNLFNNMKEHVDISQFLTMQDKSILAEFSNEIAPKEPLKEQTKEPAKENNPL